MKAKIKWVDGMSFVAQGDSGHSVVLDAPPEFGGQGAGLRPMEMVLLGVGGCTAFDVVSILRRGRHAISDCVVELDATRATEPPKVFTKIHIHYVVTGKDLSEKAVERAVKLSAEKYCSASLMIGQVAEISHDFEVRELV